MYKAPGVTAGANPRAEVALDSNFYYTRAHIATWSSQVWIDANSVDPFSFVQIFNLQKGSTGQTSMMLHAQPSYISVYSSATNALSYDFRNQWIDVTVRHNARNGAIATTVTNASGQTKTLHTTDQSGAS